MTLRFLIVTLIIYSKCTLGQNFCGIIQDDINGAPVEFVNVGVPGKNIGTVADANGRFNIQIDSIYFNDTLLFSCIGFVPSFVKIKDLKPNSDNKVIIRKKIYDLTEVIIRPKMFKQKILGVTSKNKKIMAGFKDNLLGYECGILMKAKKTCLIKKVNINIAGCLYDTIFYRLNVYKVNGNLNFSNILREPIYINIPKELVKDQVQVDLESKNIVVDGDFLVTLEHTKNLGSGSLMFCAGIGRTYYRKTSQGKWETVPIGVSMSVLADIEK